jgi:hypothetical protein
MLMRTRGDTVDAAGRIVPLLRPLLPKLMEEIVSEIRLRIAEYGHGTDTTRFTSTRLAVTQAVTYFVDHLADPMVSRAELDDTMRRIGRGEAYEGRSLDALRAAYRLGASLAWSRLRPFALEHGLSDAVLIEARHELGLFMNSLAAQAELGHAEAQRQLADAAHQWRKRVLDLVLAGTDTTDRELIAQAAHGNWPIPSHVVMIAVRRTPGLALPSARALHPHTLANLHADAPAVLHPVPLSADARTELEELFAGHRIAIGCPVPLSQAASSLRWARRALDLVERGMIPASPVVDCAEHLGVLWIHSEPLLAELVCETLLAPLFAEPPRSRRLLGETLLAWIDAADSSAPSLAARLGKHPQTVRYRLKRMREMFGPLLEDPVRRMEIRLALQVSEPRWRTGSPVAESAVRSTAGQSRSV